MLSVRAKWPGSGLFLAAALAVFAAPGAAGRTDIQATPAEIRTVPIYATARDGSPVTTLRADDLEVKLGGRRIVDFTLIKGESPNKLVFIVFDEASLDPNMLEKSKKIALAMIDRAADGVRFVVMSIDPGLGLKPVCDPTADKRLAWQSIDQSVSSKGITFLRNTPTTRRGADLTEDGQLATVILASLRTLNSVLAKFPESNKVVHLFSRGIPQGAMLERSYKRYAYVGAETTPTYSPDLDNFSSPSTETYDKIMTAGRAIKKSGAVLFAVFPQMSRRGPDLFDLSGAAAAGGPLKRDDGESSGEPSLRLLVKESGGRFFMGTDEGIVGSLSAVEQGYYELALGVTPSKRGEAVPLEVRARDRALTLSSAGCLASTRPNVPGR